MATSFLKPLHVGKGRTISTAIGDIVDYVGNPQKTDNGRLILGYECDSRTADAEFALAKREYIAKTGRVRGADDLIAYHTRQAFPPGEITPEEAQQIGYELAMSFTKGKQAFIVCTHIDRHHVHNHIIFSAVALDCTHKFRNFWGSSMALRRISDQLCLEHGLSVIENPKPRRGHYGEWLGGQKPLSFQEQIRQGIDAVLEQHPANFEDFAAQMEAAGFAAERRGTQLRFRAPGAEKFTRCDTLRGDYTEQAIRERIAGTRVVVSRRAKKAMAVPPPKVNLLIDIQEKLKEGKGAGYERWAKVYNVKQAAKALLFLQDHGITDSDTLAEKAAAATARFNALSDQIKPLDASMKANADLQKKIINYSKTRVVYAAYRKAGYSKKFLAEHEVDILIHRAAKQAFDKLGITKLPTVVSLREAYAETARQKKKTYAAYTHARSEMRELLAVKGNVEHLLGLRENRNPAKETERS